MQLPGPLLRISVERECFMFAHLILPMTFTLLNFSANCRFFQHHDWRQADYCLTLQMKWCDQIRYETLSSFSFNAMSVSILRFLVSLRWLRLASGAHHHCHSCLCWIPLEEWRHASGHHFARVPCVVSGWLIRVCSKRQLTTAMDSFLMTIWIVCLPYVRYF